MHLEIRHAKNVNIMAEKTRTATSLNYYRIRWKREMRERKSKTPMCGYCYSCRDFSRAGNSVHQQVWWISCCRYVHSTIYHYVYRRYFSLLLFSARAMSYIDFFFLCGWYSRSKQNISPSRRLRIFEMAIVYYFRCRPLLWGPRRVARKKGFSTLPTLYIPSWPLFLPEIPQLYFLPPPF